MSSVLSNENNVYLIRLNVVEIRQRSMATIAHMQTAVELLRISKIKGNDF